MERRCLTLTVFLSRPDPGLTERNMAGSAAASITLDCNYTQIGSESNVKRKFYIIIALEKDWFISTFVLCFI